MADEVTDEMVAAAWAVWLEEGDTPYRARVADCDFTDRAAGLAALHAADLEAERMNVDLMRRTITAALDGRSEPTLG